MQICSQPNNSVYSNSVSMNKSSAPSFCANPNSAKLMFKNKDFYVRLKGYGKNENWAQKVIEVADSAVKSLREGKGSEEVLQEISMGMRKANSKCDDFYKSYYTGMLRVPRDGYITSGETHRNYLQTPVVGQYKKYKKTFTKVAENPLENPYKDISLTFVENNSKGEPVLYHGSKSTVNSALDRINNLFGQLKVYIEKPDIITKENLGEINSNVAEMRWILAHATPWERGSDSIANTFMRAVYKSMGIKTAPSKRGISFDLQAYCTPLDEYKQNFPKYFDKKPKVME